MDENGNVVGRISGPGCCLLSADAVFDRFNSHLVKIEIAQTLLEWTKQSLGLNLE